ncbi:hypothetical protein IE81DRAFT_239003 [Ceraceosorus guamensis]|uniref:Uncharacterized protein n=1 Tax=Ceraceosorus guamensis TaxID=1522189 RepID=A0A316VRB5_9BASI|nr:hypothetical protein IE81DRAFT_239003 [Ceraceosorus guamensis]PWN40136.1 hypothetical protein IE81DRAFT_239003 [Ceraceosorus guamensis]
MRFSHLSTTVAFALLAGTSLAAPYGGIADEVAQAAVSASEHARNDFLSGGPGRIFWKDSSGQTHHIYHATWGHFQMMHGREGLTPVTERLWNEIMQHARDNQLIAEGVTAGGNRLRYQDGSWRSAPPSFAGQSRERGQSSRGPRT